MKHLIIALLLLVSTSLSYGQDTLSTKESKTTYTVKTYSEAVYDLTMNTFKDDIQRAGIVWKKDRNGRYKEYTLAFPIDKKEAIEAFMTKTWGKGTNKSK